LDGDRSGGIVDAHNDLLLEVAYRGMRHGEPLAFTRHWLPHLQQGRVLLQVCPLYADIAVLPESALREVLGQAAAFERAVRESDGQIVAVKAASDLELALNEDRIGLMLSLEGAEPLGYDVWMAEVFWSLGVRMISLTWNRRNPFADGAAESGEGGLSELGRQLVDACMELGMVIDLAHASERTFWELLERAEGAPIVVSHAACRTVFDHPRNLSDEQLHGLAREGGVMGVMLHPIAVDSNEPTIDRVVDHIDHAVQIMGIDGVGLGSDFTQQIVRTVGWVPPSDSLLPASMKPDAAIEGLAGPQDFPNLVAALERRGYEGERLQAVLGQNLLRTIRQALAPR
jgi:membrane dipeptidase